MNWWRCGSDRCWMKGIPWRESKDVRWWREIGLNGNNNNEIVIHQIFFITEFFYCADDDGGWKTWVKFRRLLLMGERWMQRVFWWRWEMKMYLVNEWKLSLYRNWNDSSSECEFPQIVFSSDEGFISCHDMPCHTIIRTEVAGWWAH